MRPPTYFKCGDFSNKNWQNCKNKNTLRIYVTAKKKKKKAHLIVSEIMLQNNFTYIHKFN